jgi:serine/threonine-protein kinase
VTSPHFNPFFEKETAETPNSGFETTCVLIPVPEAEHTLDPETSARLLLRPSSSDLMQSESEFQIDQMPTIGHIGRYALKERLGTGGLGTVYAAHDPVLSRLIAIKTLNVDLPLEERESFNAMFLNEARAAARLGHPYIVTIHDAGLSDQGVYIAMELLRGNDLRQWLKEGWRPSIGQAALTVRRVAEALAYAHTRGVIHRDIKPANIFMVGKTQPRVLDFGIAQITYRRERERTSDPQHATTQPPDDNIIGGSPYYMSPEQRAQGATDGRTDVFSLGVVLYELLTGERPFQGENFQAIDQAVREHTPPLVHEINTEIPASLSKIVARALEKLPAKRHSSARSLARELRDWQKAHPQFSEILAAADPDDGAASNSVFPMLFAKPLRPHKRLWLAAAAAFSVATVTAVLLWSSTSMQPNALINAMRETQTTNPLLALGQGSAPLLLNTLPELNPGLHKSPASPVLPSWHSEDQGLLLKATTNITKINDMHAPTP